MPAVRKYHMFLRKNHCCFIGIVLVSTAFLLYSWTGSSSNLKPSSNTTNLGLEYNTFFLETSGKPTMNLRCLLSVEAAARHLKNLRHLQVFIFVEGDPPNASKTPIMWALETNYKVLTFKFVTMYEVAKGTPLQRWYDSAERTKSPYKVTHASDAYRFLLTWLHGGVYLDTDIILMKDVTFVSNTLMREREDAVASALLAFKKGHPFVKKLLDDFVAHYKPNDWGSNGPNLVNNQYRTCSHEKECDVVALPPEALLPIGYPKETQYFDESLSSSVLEKIKNSLGIHFGNSYTNNLKVFSNSTSAFATIARRNCPIVWAEIEKVGLT